MAVSTRLSASNLFAGAGTAATPAQEKPKAKLWANLGVTTQIVNAEGETVDAFVQLPLGIPLDTMEKQKVPHKEGNRKDLISAGNQLLDNLIAAGFEIPAGESVTISGLEIQIVHVTDEPAAPSNNIIVPSFTKK